MKFLSPGLVAGLAIAMSVGVGVSMTWRTLETVAAQATAAAEAKVPKATVEQKKKGWDFWTIEIENLSNELKEEKQRLKKRSEQLDERSARVAAEEKELAKLRADVESMRRQMSEKVVEIATDEAKNIKTLAATYTTLTPKAAVAIFKEMDDSTAVKILSVMKPDVVGPIFEEMSKAASVDASMARRAALLSEKLRMMKAAKAGNPS